jgi:putative colanic acid biosynthesis UDP-glucose lipid carrier transferase
VKPGITGLAQVRGFRGETRTNEDVVKRVESDIYYLENWSLFLDVWIILRTAWQVIFPPRTAL